MYRLMSHFRGIEQKKIMMLANLSGLSNHRFRAAGAEEFADVRAVGSARRRLWSRRREASTTSRFIDREFNRPQVSSSFAARVWRSKKRDRQRRKKHLAFNFLKSSCATIRRAGVPRLISIAENPTKRHALCVSNVRTRILVSSFSLFLSFASLWFGLYLVDTGILWPWTLYIARWKCLLFFFFFFSWRWCLRICLHAR